MKLSKVLISFLPIFLLSMAVFAQETENEGSLNSGTIESQFEFLYKKSGRYEDYRVIKISQLLKFRNNVYDTLKLDRKKYLDSQNLIASQKNNIDSLNQVLEATNGNLASVTKEKDSIKLFGMQMSKVGYNTLLWTIIAGLTAFLVLFISRFKRSNTITIEAKNAKAEIEEEYEEHRQRALEREQKLRRELQDELNKQKYAKQAAAKKGSK
ncbi:MAG: tRNA (guanine-N1)-methyltransferase [Aureibaculum sp.]